MSYNTGAGSGTGSARGQNTGPGSEYESGHEDGGPDPSVSASGGGPRRSESDDEEGMIRYKLHKLIPVPLVF